MAVQGVCFSRLLLLVLVNSIHGYPYAGCHYQQSHYGKDSEQHLAYYSPLAAGTARTFFVLFVVPTAIVVAVFMPLMMVVLVMMFVMFVMFVLMVMVMLVAFIGLFRIIHSFVSSILYTKLNFLPQQEVELFFLIGKVLESEANLDVCHGVVVLRSSTVVDVGVF